MVKQIIVQTEEEVNTAFHQMKKPLVMKVIGHLHKSEFSGVKLNIQTEVQVTEFYAELMKIPGASGVLMQTMLSGNEFFIGAKKEENFGHLILCGLGGIFVEVFRDISSALSPLSREEAVSMIKRLRSYPVIKGVRGKKGIREELIVDVLMRVSALLEAAPEIEEMDINPLIGTNEFLEAVDVRIKISSTRG